MRKFLVSCERDEVSIQILHDERAGAPRLRSQCLVERDSCLLKLQEEGLGVVERERRRKGITFPGTKPAVEYWPADPSQVQPPPIASDLSVEGRFSIGEHDLEAKFVDIKRAGGFDVRDEELRFRRDDDGGTAGGSGGFFHAPDSLDQ